MKARCSCSTSPVCSKTRRWVEVDPDGAVGEASEAAASKAARANKGKEGGKPKGGGGAQLSEEDKARVAARAARFGLPTVCAPRLEPALHVLMRAHTVRSLLAHRQPAEPSGEDAEKMKKRADRFGNTEPAAAPDPEEEERRKKRAARFAMA